MLGGAKHVGGCTNEVGGCAPPHPPRKSASVQSILQSCQTICTYVPKITLLMVSNLTKLKKLH